jgi:hypothetical protein
MMSWGVFDITVTRYQSLEFSFFVAAVNLPLTFLLPPQNYVSSDCKKKLNVWNKNGVQY